jgi:hypothetical protein
MSPREQRVLVLSGFLVRLIAGLFLLYGSSSGLSVAGGLSLGDGRWVFAVDGDGYRAHAARAAAQGIGGILTYDRNVPAVSYVQLLALFIPVFGTGILTALIVNLVCYLLTCWLVVRWASMVEAPRQVTFFVLVALSFSPSAILWATQPLKESFFQLLVVALAFTALCWQRAWRASRFCVAALLVAALLSLLFVLSGVRWYFAVVALFGLLAAFAWTLMETRRGRVVLLIGAIPAILLMGRAVTAGGGSSVLPYLRNTLRLDPQAVRHLPEVLTILAPEIRGNLSRLDGKSVIANTDSTRPSTHMERLGTGLLATFAPLSLNRVTGWIQIQSGGLYRLLVADIDTLFFDAVVIGGLILSRRRRMTSVFLFLAILTVVITVAVVYIIPNFGLLFRLRLLILTGCALLPLAACAGSEKQSGDLLDAAQRDDVHVGVDLGRV